MTAGRSQLWADPKGLMLSLKMEFQNEIKNEILLTILYLFIRAPIRPAKYFRKQQLGIMRTDSSAEAQYPESPGTEAKNAMTDSAQQLDGREQAKAVQSHQQLQDRSHSHCIHSYVVNET